MNAKQQMIMAIVVSLTITLGPVSILPAWSFADHPSSTSYHPASPSVLASCPSVSTSRDFVENSASFQTLPRVTTYTMTATGEEVEGNTCRTVLFFMNHNNDSIEAIVNPTYPLSMYQFSYMPALHFRADTSQNWSGYEAQYCSNQGWWSCNGTGQVGQTDMGSTAENIGTPSPAVNNGCCAVTVWTGLSNVSEPTKPVLIQDGFTSTNQGFGNNLYMWYEMLPAANQPIATGGCFNFNYGDKVSIDVVWNGGSSYTFFFDDNDPNTSCSLYVNATYSNLTNPTWAQYIVEAPTNPACPWTKNICQLPSWSNAYPLQGWVCGSSCSQNNCPCYFDANHDPISSTNMNQGCKDNVDPSGVQYGAFTAPYLSSAQQGYNC